jgi:hypothetical protein
MLDFKSLYKNEILFDFLSLFCMQSMMMMIVLIFWKFSYLFRSQNLFFIYFPSTNFSTLKSRNIIFIETTMGDFLSSSYAFSSTPLLFSHTKHTNNNNFECTKKLQIHSLSQSTSESREKCITTIDSRLLSSGISIWDQLYDASSTSQSDEQTLFCPCWGRCGAAIAYITETTRVYENDDVVRLPRFFAK